MTPSLVVTHRHILMIDDTLSIHGDFFRILSPDSA